MNEKNMFRAIYALGAVTIAVCSIVYLMYPPLPPRIPEPMKPVSSDAAMLKALNSHTVNTPRRMTEEDAINFLNDRYGAKIAKERW